MDLDLELNLNELWGAATSAVSSLPPQKTIEIVVDEKDRSKGYLILEVRGFTVEDAKPLRRSFYGSWSAYQAVQQYKQRRLLELNPQGEPGGEAFAKATVEAELGHWQGEATKRLLEACRQICFLGVVGYPAGTLRHKGVEVPFATEDRELLGKKRTGLCSHALALLEATLITLRLAQEILDISSGADPTPKEAQWTKGEAPESATPLAETGGPVVTLESSPQAPRSASPSASAKASRSAKPRGKRSALKATTAPSVAPDLKSSEDAASQVDTTPALPPSMSTTTSPNGLP